MRKISLFLMSMLYFFAGVNHFWHPVFYLKIMPSWLGFHETLLAISGVCEIVVALLLLPNKTRPLAAWCTILLLIFVFPANIQMMINYANEHNPRLWVAILRLLMQGLLVWWAYTFTKN